jgi:hypothetical protein
MLDVQARDGESAQARYLEAGGLHEQLGRPLGRAHAAVGAGDAAALLGHTDAARDAYSRALGLYEQQAYASGQIAALERLARLSSDDPQKAAEYQARASVLRNG